LPTQIVDGQGRFEVLEYDPLYRLINNVKDSTGLKAQTKYEYSAVGRLLKITDPNGNVTTFERDSLDRVIKQIDAQGNTTTFSYDKFGNILSQTDPKGGVTKFEYDALNRLVKQIDTLGQIKKFDYDPSNNLIQKTDQKAMVTKYDFDDLNRITSKIENYKVGVPSSSNTNIATSFTYDLVGNLTSITNPRGFKTSFTYDAVNRNTVITDSQGSTTNFEYDKVGNLIKTTDRNGNPTTNSYDELNRLIASINAENLKTQASYDKVGNPVQTIDPKGAATTYNYDGLNRLVAKKDALGGTEKNVYDLTGNLLTQINPNGQVSSFEYDKIYRQTKQTDQEGNFQTSAYDANSNQVKITDRNGNSTSYDYDALNRLTQTTDANGGKQIYTYDPTSNLLSQTDANGNITTFEVDPLNRTVKQTDPEGNATFFDYDANGNTVKVTDANGNATSYEFDNLDRNTKSIDAENRATSFGYDKEFSQTIKTQADGVVTSYNFDKIYRLISVVENAKSGGPIDSQTNVTTNYSYDGNDNLVKITDANGHQSSFEFDALNRLLNQKDADNNSWKYGYDGVGNRTQKVDAGGQVTSYSYYPDNQLAKISYAKPDTATKIFNTNGVIDVTKTAGFAITFGYDKNNNRVSMQDNLGNTSWTLNKLNQITQVTDSLSQTIKYSYDKVGNKTSLTYPDGRVVSYSYQKNNWLSKVTNPDKSSIKYTTDKVGNVTRLSNSNSTFTQTSSDKVYQVKDIKNYASGQELDHDDRGGDDKNEDKKIQQEKDDQKAKQAQLISSWQYQYDVVGQRVKTTITDFTGKKEDESNKSGKSKNDDDKAVKPLVSNYSYDPLRRLIQSNDSTGLKNSYAYDAVGNRLQFITNQVQGKNPDENQKFENEDKITELKQTYSYSPANKLLNILAETKYANEKDKDHDDERDEDKAQKSKSADKDDSKSETKSSKAIEDKSNKGDTEVKSSKQTVSKTSVVFQTLAQNQAQSSSNKSTATTSSKSTSSSNSTTSSNSLSSSTKSSTSTKDDSTKTSESPSSYKDQSSKEKDDDNKKEDDSKKDEDKETKKKGKLNYGSDSVTQALYALYDEINQNSIHHYSQQTTTILARQTILLIVDLESNRLDSPTAQSRLNELKASIQKASSDNLIDSSDVTASLIAKVDKALEYASSLTIPAPAEVKKLQAATFSYNNNGNRTNQRNYQITKVNDYLQPKVNTDNKEDKDSKQKNKNEESENEKEKQIRGLQTIINGQKYTYDYENRLTSGQKYHWNKQPNSENDGNKDSPLQRGDSEGVGVFGSLDLSPKTTLSYDGIGRRLIKTYATHKEDDDKQRNEEYSKSSVGEGLSFQRSNENNKNSKDDKQDDSNIARTQYTYDNLDPITIKNLQTKQTTQLYRNPQTQSILASNNINKTKEDEDKYQKESKEKQTKSTTTFYTHDALDSITGIAKSKGEESGKVVSYSDFGSIKNQGEEGNSNLSIDFSYTNQEYDSNLNLYEFYSRAYDPTTGSWLQQDSYLGKLNQPQSLHRYSYVRNSPITLRDYYGYYDIAGSLYQAPTVTQAVNTLITGGAGVVVAAGEAAPFIGLAALGSCALYSGYLVVAPYYAPSQYNQRLNDQYGNNADEYDSYYRNPGILTWGANSGQNSGARGIDGNLYYSTPKNFKQPTNSPQSAPEIPEDWIETDAANGKGKVYTNPNNPNDTIRVMDPTPDYPNGYWVETSPKTGQPIDPSTGKPGTKPETHVPLP